MFERGTLQNLLEQALPEYCDSGGVLHVKRLHLALSLSHEGVYKWLRSNKIASRSAREVIKLSESPENAALLSANGIATTEFCDFCESFP